MAHPQNVDGANNLKLWNVTVNIIKQSQIDEKE
jgi:hypothetical protein